MVQSARQHSHTLSDLIAQLGGQEGITNEHVNAQIKISLPWLLS